MRMWKKWQKWILLYTDGLIFLLVLNVLLFLIPSVLNFLIAGGVEGYSLLLNLLGAQFTGVFDSGIELWRLITANFLHVNAMHLGLNMFSLWIFGKWVVQYYGHKYLVAFYILSGLVGSVFSMFFLGDSLTVGASGAVFGLLGVLLANSVKKQRYGPDFALSSSNLLPVVIISLAWGFLPFLNINNAAHVGGLITGFAFGYLIDHKITTNRKSWHKHLEDGLFWFSVVLLLISYALMVFNLVGVLSI